MNVSPGETLSPQEKALCEELAAWMRVYMCVYMGVCLIKSVFWHIWVGNIPSPSELWWCDRILTMASLVNLLFPVCVCECVCVCVCSLQSTYEQTDAVLFCLPAWAPPYLFSQAAESDSVSWCMCLYVCVYCMCSPLSPPLIRHGVTQLP